MFLTTLMNWVLWAAVAFSILATIVNIKAWRKTRRSCRQILARWQTESPPVGEAEVVLKTGDRIHRRSRRSSSTIRLRRLSCRCRRGCLDGRRHHAGLDHSGGSRPGLAHH